MNAARSANREAADPLSFSPTVTVDPSADDVNGAPAIPRTGDGPPRAEAHNRLSVTVLEASDAFLDAISPELILVSPPEIAQLARARLPVFPQPVPIVPKAGGRSSPRTIELIAAYVFCLLVTLGPLGFIILADPISRA
jgi:hypothetical protein